MKITVRILGIAVLLLGALAIERTYLAQWHGLRAAASDGERMHRVLARVVAARPGVPMPPASRVPFTPPARYGDPRLEPRAAEVLTGALRGRLVVFVSAFQDRPFVNVPARPGRLVALTVTTRKGVVRSVYLNRPAVRWRMLLWTAALFGAAAIALMGVSGLRAMLMALGAGAVVWFITAPLLARAYAPFLVILLTFVPLAGLILLTWWMGWRPSVCAAAATLAGLMAGTLVAFASTRLMGFTGEASALVRLLRGRPAMRDLDFGGLLAAGMTVMAAGAALDIAASVVSGMMECRAAKPDISRAEVRRAGLHINRSVAGTMVLTLGFAWLAIHLPVVLVMRQGGEVFDARWVACYAAEVVQIVSACIAVLLAGPISAALYARFAGETSPEHPATDAPPTRRRLRGALPLALLAVIAGAMAAQCVRMTLPPPESQMDLKDLAEQTSADQVLTWAGEWRDLGDLDASFPLLWRAHDLAPKDGRVYRDLAYAWMARGRPRLAQKALVDGAEVLPSDALTHYVVGVVALWAGDGDTARKALRRALELKPDFIMAQDALRKVR